MRPPTTGTRGFGIILAQLTAITLVTAVHAQTAPRHALGVWDANQENGCADPQSNSRLLVTPTETHNSDLHCTRTRRETVVGKGEVRDMECTDEGNRIELIGSYHAIAPNRLGLELKTLRNQPYGEPRVFFRCPANTSALVQKTTPNVTPATAAADFVLPPLREGEYYAGQPYLADYDERRTELLGEKAKPLTRLKDERCAHAICKRYPEIRACATSATAGTYCVGRWQRANGATVDYVVSPETLEVLKTVCRDTCGADEIRPQGR